MTTELDNGDNQPHGFASGFKPQSAPVSAANARLCHICGSTFPKASLPAHQRNCLRKSVRTGNRNMRSGSMYPSFAGGPEGQAYMMSGKTSESIARQRLSAPFSSPARQTQPVGRSSTAAPSTINNYNPQHVHHTHDWSSSPSLGHHEAGEHSHYRTSHQHQPHYTPEDHYDEPFEDDEESPHERPIRRTAAAAAEYVPTGYIANNGSRHGSPTQRIAPPASSNASRFVPKKTIIAQHPASAHTRGAHSARGVSIVPQQVHANQRTPVAAHDSRYNNNSDEEWPSSSPRKPAPPVQQDRLHEPSPAAPKQPNTIGIPMATEDDDPNNFSWRDFAPLQQQGEDVKDDSGTGKADWDNGGGDADSRLPCPICGRKFLEQERLDKHMGACSKAKKPRKTYDATKARVKGTELEQYASKAKANGMLDDRKAKATSHEDTQLKPKGSNWRLKHDKFIQMVRAARQPLDRTNSTTSNGHSTSSLPTAATSSASLNDPDPDLVPCAHCGRRFQKDTAARHIPFCKESKQKAMYRANAMRPAQNSAANAGGTPSKSDRMKIRTAYKPPLPKAKGAGVKASPGRDGP